ncbi:MAG: DUF1638 domain-containing protein [Eubacteriales bacterium]
MNYKLLACKVLQRECSHLCAQSDNFIDITYLRQGFHNTPARLRELLQAEIDAIDAECDTHSKEMYFDAILLGYGLCSNGIVGLHSARHTLVVPRAHDCITLLLGSKERYRDYFDACHGGIYWYSKGWLENAPMPSKERYDQLFKEYCEQYGEDNATYLLAEEQSWLTRYQHCKYIEWKELPFESAAAYTEACADFLHWQFERLTGSSRLLADMLAGQWDPDRFLVVPPGETIRPSNGPDILSCQACPPADPS